jgi:hypothetical protein
MKRKEKPSDTCENGRRQKPFGPTIETFSSHHSEQNNQAGKNSD